MKLLRSFFHIVVLGVFATSLFACALPAKDGAGGEAPKSDKSEEKKKQQKKEELKRQIEITKMKLEIAKTSLKNTEMENEVSLAKAKAERDLAEREMRQFTEVDMPRRLEEGRLRFQESKDGVQDAKEELAQLEDMYKDGDLADKTREIVLQRGRRRVERAMRWLALQEIDLKSQENFRLPVEKERLSLSLKEKSDAMAKTERDAAKEKAEKTIALREVENEVAKQEAELAEQGEAKS